MNPTFDTGAITAVPCRIEKHPDCEDRCQLREHKGYIDCSMIGQCIYAVHIPIQGGSVD